MKGKLMSASGLVLAGVLFIAINLLGQSSLKGWRLDLSENELYTLSPGTHRILAALEEPIKLRLYLSERLATQLPGINSYAARVKELLEEYELASRGKLTLVLIDPEPFSEEEDRAVGYGIRGVPLETGDDTFYFGLVGSGSVDQEEVIPFFSLGREQFLEYDLTKLIYQLATVKKRAVGLLSSLPVDGGGGELAFMGGQGGNAWMVIEQLHQLFDVRTLSPSLSEIPEDIDVLMVVHPKGLVDRARYALDQFVLGGGKALVFVDPYCESDPAGPQAGGSSRSELDDLLAAWGLELAPQVVADLRFATRVQTERDGKMLVLDYPVWMNLGASQLSPVDPITSGISNLTLASAGYLKRVTREGLDVIPLIRSSSESALVETSVLGFGSDPRDILRDYSPKGEEMPIAVRVTGKAKSAFPDGRPIAESDGAEGEGEGETAESETDSGSAQPKPHLGEAPEGVNVVVVADVDFLADRFWVQVQNFLGSRIAVPSAGNGTFVANAVDNLMGSGDLISVRSRGVFTRPFDRIDALKQRAELEFREKEDKLMERLEETERHLIELESQKQGEEALILSEAQQQEIVRFRQEKIGIRKELREVRRELRRDIDDLQVRMKFINIGLTPIAVVLGGLVLVGLRVRGRASGR